MGKKNNGSADLKSLMEEVRAVAGDDEYTVHISTSAVGDKKNLQIETTIKRNKFT